MLLCFQNPASEYVLSFDFNFQTRRSFIILLGVLNKQIVENYKTTKDQGTAKRQYKDKHNKIIKTSVKCLETVLTQSNMGMNNDLNSNVAFKPLFYILT